MPKRIGVLSRYAADLPPVGEMVDLGEGDTPLLPLGRIARALRLGRLSAKIESANPTGSYKDRVAAMSVSIAVDRGHRGWISTSSGNGGLAMAAYGTRAGLPGFLCMVPNAPAEKLLPILAYDVAVAVVEDIGGRATKVSEIRLLTEVAEIASRENLFVGVTTHSLNPLGMRGIDTLSYELAEQCPDLTHVYVPTGGGGLLTAVARGLAHRSVYARLVACQPAGCAPVARCLRGELSDPVVERGTSAISALQLPNPPDGSSAVAAVGASGGWGTCPDDEAILVAQRWLATSEGIFVEPASAAALAALCEDVREGRVGAEDHPVLILTGAGWKDLSRVQRVGNSPASVNCETLGRWVEKQAR